MRSKVLDAGTLRGRFHDVPNRLGRDSITPDILEPTYSPEDYATIDGGVIFRRVSRLENIWGDGITPKAIWHIVKAAAKRAGIRDLAPHDLRRTCARLCQIGRAHV